MATKRRAGCNRPAGRSGSPRSAIAARHSADAAASLARAQAAGVQIEASLPTNVECDLAIDAVFGLGTARAAGGPFADALRLFNRLRGPRLAVDLPSGLDSDHGFVHGEIGAQATHTLALLTLKPGQFTGHGREQCGEVWFDDLGSGDAMAAVPPQAWLGGADAALEVPAPRQHARHKGNFGDVIIVGGAAGMGGAALLAGRAALVAGAGRVYVSALDPAAPQVDALWPELMLRPDLWRANGTALASATVVCGCGGGDAVREALPLLMARAARLVLDADALNAIAADSGLQTLLMARAGRGQATVLTPHPLEAARLAGITGAAAGAIRPPRPGPASGRALGLCRAAQGLGQRDRGAEAVQPHQRQRQRPIGQCRHGRRAGRLAGRAVGGSTGAGATSRRRIGWPRRQPGCTARRPRAAAIARR